ncbi:MAG: hypothetical protein ACFFAU_02300 [Candidatus Hodarchaeota archaeon]
MSDEDPLNQLVETLKVLENPDRALCLMAVYLGQKADQNTIQGITDIYSVLVGKDTQPTASKVRGLITTLVNSKLIERERERMISSTKVSFHQISPLGEISLLYVIIFLVNNPHEIKLDKLQFTSYMAGDSEFKLSRYIANSALKSDKQTNKILKALREGTDPSKLRQGKPVPMNIPKIFSGKGGFNSFKIFEELIWDYLHLNAGVSRTEIESHFESAIGSNINRLTPLIHEETIGKTKYYKLSTFGIFILPILALLIRFFSVDNSILPSLLTKNFNSDKNPWIILVERAKLFFISLYKLV